MGIRLLAWRRRGRLGRWWVRACVSGVSVGVSRRDGRAALCACRDGRVAAALASLERSWV